MLSEAEAAARFLYLNHYCFNGIYRTNRRGKFNVPFGPPKSGADINFQVIGPAAVLLRRATLLNFDFEETLDRIEPGDFAYLDPPYAVNQRRIFGEYHPNAFGINDLARLEKCMKQINRRKAVFLVSYADSREARELLAPWKPVRVRAQRHIAGFSGARRHAYELLATNSKELAYVV